VKLVNSDYLDASASSLVIQEERNEEHHGREIEGGDGRVRRSRRLRAVARVDTPSPLRPGEWESSGVIDASDLLGAGRWLLDVQATSERPRSRDRTSGRPRRGGPGEM